MQMYATLVTTHTSTTNSNMDFPDLDTAIAEIQRVLRLDVKEIYRDETRVILIRAPIGALPEGLVIISK